MRGEMLGKGGNMGPARVERSRILHPGLFLAIMALFLFGLAMSGCSKKNEAPSAPKKAIGRKTIGVPSHKAPPHTNPHDPAMEHFFKGLRLSQTHKYDLAIKEYREVLKKRPKSAEAYNNIGFAYYDMKDYKRAIKNHKKALEINHDLANAYFGLALAYEKKGEKKKALANWQEFTKRADPGSKWHKKAMEHIKDLTKNQKQKTH